MDQIAKVIETLGSQWITYEYTRMIVNGVLGCVVLVGGGWFLYKMVQKLMEL